MKFKVGDKVVFKKGALKHELHRSQAVGVGTITETDRTYSGLDVEIRWEDGSMNFYASCDLTHYQENHMRTIPTKEQVLQAAKECPQTRDALKILFPEDFKVKFPWRDFYNYSFKYLTCRGDSIEIADSLINAYKEIGKPNPGSLYPSVTLQMLKELFTFLADNYPVDCNMAYTVINFPTKKALKEAVAAGQAVRCYQPGLGPSLTHFTGTITLEGPHYPQPHRWYASVRLVDGIVVSVR